MIAILFGILLLIFVGFYFQRVQKYKVIDDYPGPSSWEIAKFMILPKSTVATYKYLVSLSEKYGPVVKVWIKPFRPTLLVADQKFLKHILLSKEHVHKAEIFNLLRPITGDGLPTISDIPLWRRERKQFTAIFSNKMIMEYTSTFKMHASKLSDSIKKNLNKPVDLPDLILRHALNIVFELLTNEDISEQDERVNSYMASLRTFFHVMFDRMNSLHKLNDTVFKLTNSYNVWNKTSQDAKEFAETTLKRILRMKKGTENKSERKDFFDLLLQTEMSYDRMLSNLQTFIVAGSDTISTCVSFTLYELAKRPDMQEKIYNEYISILGEGENACAEFRDIQNMTYTECVIKESLRMHPPVPMVYRQLVTPAEIDGKLIPADMDVIFSFVASHKMNFENPSEFNPDRFLPENSGKLPAHGYAPFSLGPRDCIGKAIGTVESKFLVSYIIRRFTVHPIEDHKLDLAGEIVLMSTTGIPVIFRERIS